MKLHHLSLVALTLFCFSNIASAAHHEDRIDGEALQQKAEEILKSEPAAQEVTVSVEIEAKKQEGKQSIELDDLDLNKDGILAHNEVGERLFQIFDRDNNQLIDNIEMYRPSLIVFTHMEQKNIETISYHENNKAQKKTVTYQEFLKESKLSRFDKNKDGLSPLDFLEMTFNEVNIIDDAVINFYEWERAYAESVRPVHMENYNYND
jgi:hypothetical protein